MIGVYTIHIYESVWPERRERGRAGELIKTDGNGWRPSTVYSFLSYLNLVTLDYTKNTILICMISYIRRSLLPSPIWKKTVLRPCRRQGSCRRCRRCFPIALSTYVRTLSCKIFYANVWFLTLCTFGFFFCFLSKSLNHNCYCCS
jgi:hypothetical protein